MMSARDGEIMDAKISELLAEIERLQAIVDRLRRAAEKAASAPGINWLSEQYQLANVLVELDREAAEAARKEKP